MFKDVVKKYLKNGIDTDCGILSTPYGNIAIGEKVDVLSCVAMLLRELRLKGLINEKDLESIIKAVMTSEEDLDDLEKCKETAKKSLDDIRDTIKRIEKLIEE